MSYKDSFYCRHEELCNKIDEVYIEDINHTFMRELKEIIYQELNFGGCRQLFDIAFNLSFEAVDKNDDDLATRIYNMVELFYMFYEKSS